MTDATVTAMLHDAALAARFVDDDQGLATVPGDLLRKLILSVRGLAEERKGLRAALQQLLDAYEDGTPQCCCANSGYASPAPCVTCCVRDALAE